ncbi:ABC transporter permease [Actinocrispum wychmicini]|uniref:Peptide/nickel transport system permease protein n=1 Tax=Actinocrispum wychmicini TaxID=1213861 RepID=A0A4R2JQ34_9PSEU|nr:ABC transporter permease [Actinocrispum wychmicini]TCO62321.1 peptide/nickel transport system permease protein [Actinocrispum wychmicini]
MSDSLRWWVRRLLLAVLVVFGAATVTFGALRLEPGDPVRLMLGPNVNPPPELVDQVRHDLGLDRPLIEQYGLFLGRLGTGDLGRSYQLHDSVANVIGEHLGSTVALALTGFLLAFALGLLIAVATAGRRPALRGLSSTVELIMTSTPGFWVGVLLLTLFSFRLHAFPVAGGTGLAGLVLPAVTLALGMAGVFAQVLREGLERALAEPFVVSARARGTGETMVRLRHALRHAMVPMVTIAGWAVGALLSGAVVIETVFSRPGLGHVLATAVAGRDFPLVTGIAVVSAALFAVISVIVDGLYRVIDPRLRDTGVSA